MRLVHVRAGSPGKRPVRFSHAPPSFRVSHTLPSSVPAHRRPGRTGDSASAVIVPCASAPVTSGVMPPVVRRLVLIFAESLVDRSGEIGTKRSPRFTLLMTRLPAAYTVRGLCGERKNGVFQL